MADVELVQRIAGAIRENVGRVIVGKNEVVELLLAALFCEGHVLLEDVPGIGKTTLAKAMSRSLGCVFRRIQFTPDLLPSDITGVNVFNQKTNDFEFRPGPILAQVVLADEINRAGPRTQSALLEAMEERQMTVDGVTHALPYPFFVMATQNPVELEGTFPLPEAQMDRFLMRVALGYPQREEERQILRRFQRESPLLHLEPAVSTADLQSAHAVCQEIHLHPALEDYLLDLVQASRANPAVELGVSPRGTMALFRSAQALAAIRGREYIIPDDIKQLVTPVLAHRLILSADTRLHGRSTQSVLDELVESVAVPVEEVWEADGQVRKPRPPGGDGTRPGRDAPG